MSTNVAGAIEHYDRAATLDPLDPLIHWKLSHAHRRLEDYAKMETSLVRALQLAPGEGLYWEALAFARMELAPARGPVGWEEMKSAALRCLEARDPSATCHFYAALAHDRLSEVREALRHYEQAVIADSGQARYYVAWASLLERERRFTEASRVVAQGEQSAQRLERDRPHLYELYRLAYRGAARRKQQAAMLVALESAYAVGADQYPESGFELGEHLAKNRSESARARGLELLSAFVKRACKGAARQNFEAQCSSAERRLAR